MNKPRDSHSDQFAARLGMPEIKAWPKRKRRVPRPPKPPKERRTNGHSQRKHKHNPEELYAMYQTQPLSQIAKVKGLSTERIRQILHGAGYSTRIHIGKGGRRRQIPIERIIDLRKQGLTITAIAREVNLSATTVWTHLQPANIIVERPLTPIGCPKCITEPLARGLCHNCYHKWLKRGKPEGVASPKVLMPIGCEDCKTKPFVKGLCRRCYARKWDRERRGRLKEYQ